MSRITFVSVTYWDTGIIWISVYVLMMFRYVSWLKSSTTWISNATTINTVCEGRIWYVSWLTSSTTWISNPTVYRIPTASRVGHLTAGRYVRHHPEPNIGHPTPRGFLWHPGYISQFWSTPGSSKKVKSKLTKDLKTNLLDLVSSLPDVWRRRSTSKVVSIFVELVSNSPPDVEIILCVLTTKIMWSHQLIWI